MNKKAFIQGFRYTISKYAEGTVATAAGQTGQEANKNTEGRKTNVPSRPMTESEYNDYYGAKYNGRGLVGVTGGTYEQDLRDAYRRYLSDYMAQHGGSTSTNNVASTTRSAPLYYAEQPPRVDNMALWRLGQLLSNYTEERQPHEQEVASVR